MPDTIGIANRRTPLCEVRQVPNDSWREIGEGIAKKYGLRFGALMDGFLILKVI